jgi:hypothetical protein
MSKDCTLVTILMRTEIDPITQCWNWRGALSKSGYGNVRYKTKVERVSRLVYQLLNPSMAKELHVLHRCDNPKCCNPEHLFSGTHKENMEDMQKKGRHVGNSPKLNPEQEQEVVRLRLLGNTRPAVAKAFNVSVDTIDRITAGKIPYLPKPSLKKVRITKGTFEQVFVSQNSAAKYLGRTQGAVHYAANHGTKCAGYTVEYV